MKTVGRNQTDCYKIIIMKAEHIIGVKEIAKKANVSIATVDRVLHNRPGVSVSTKKKIENIIKKYNYQPNILARRLASRKVLRFATLIPSVSKETDYWQAPLDGIVEAEGEIKQFGINIEKYFFDLNDKQTFITESKKILATQVDGILLAPSFVADAKKFAEECEKRKIPYVFINSDVPQQDNLCYIGPDLYSSGYMGAHLVNLMIKENEKALVVNISRVPDSLYHVERKEEGFRAYFEKGSKKIQILKTEIRKTDYPSIKKELAAIFSTEKIKVVFVTNSRVFYVAKFLEEQGIKDVALIGFDFTEKNLKYLEKGAIDFLICQKPQLQAYKGIMALYTKLVRNEKVEKTYYMSIDIIARENYKFYKN